MAADIINLRHARKDKARTEKQRAAEANRIAFGRTKTEKRVSDIEKDAAARKLDGHRLKDD